MSRFGFDKVIENMRRQERELPHVLGNTVVQHFLASFREQGFDEGVEKWQQVKRCIPGTREYLYPKKKGLSRRTKPVLVNSGRLRRAVASSLREASMRRIRLVVDVPYARYHNEGTGTLPQRRFMGHSRRLNQKLRNRIGQAISTIWRG